MSYFIKKFNYNQSAGFNSIIKPTNWNGILILGRLGSDGLLVFTDFNGMIIWERKFTLPNLNCTLVNAAETDDGHVMVLGHNRINSQSGYHIIFKINQNGTLIWRKRINIYGNSRKSISLLSMAYANDNSHYYKPTFLIAGWHHRSGKDFIEGTRIEEDGTILAPYTFGAGGTDEQLMAIRPGSEKQKTSSGDEFIIPTVYHVGLTTNNGLKGFVFDTLAGHFYLKYGVYGKSFHVKNSNFTQSEAIISLGPNQFLLAATYEKNGVAGRKSLLIIGEISRGYYHQGTPAYLSFNKTIGFNFTSGKDRIRKIIQIGNTYYVLGFDLISLRPFITKLDNQLNPLWEGSKSLWFEEDVYLTDLFDLGNNVLFLSGFLRDSKTHDTPIIVRTDYNLTTCQTILVPLEMQGSLIVNIEELYRSSQEQPPINLKTTGIREQEIGEIYQVSSSSIVDICPEEKLEVEASHLLQSPYLYLQAAGSLGRDSTPGIHLRWHLQRNLGETHIPKGDYATTTHNFNRKDDFVRIYRAPYERIEIIYPILNMIPFSINDEDAYWVYKLPGKPVCYLHWRSKFRYNQIRQSINPSSSGLVMSFFMQYGNELLEFEIKDDLAFAARFKANGSNNNSFKLQVEAFSVEEKEHNAARQITARKEFTRNNAGNMRVVAENMRSLKFKVTAGQVYELSIETYAGILEQILKKGTADKIGDFALTKDTYEAFQRLQDDSRTILHDKWKKFNGNAKVNIHNYKKRWHDDAKPDTGILKGVESYISLSDQASNPTAKASLSANSPDTPDIEISYLDMLLLAGTDYHVGRMLGKAHIDTQPVATPDKAYIYIAEYFTEGELDDGLGARKVQHLSLSAPTRQKDERLPVPIGISSITYGLKVQPGTQAPIIITDEEGYTPDGQSRFINIWANQQIHNSQSNDFFNPSTIFEAVQFTWPVFAGVEYRKQNGQWESPEIAHDEDFVDTDGVKETIPIVFNENGTKPIFIHEERREGIHEYAVYSINIFSRASDISSPLATNFTKFTRANTLLPPSDLRVQLIQPENPLVLTTDKEQVHLAGLSGDKTYVRVTFNYSHIQDRNYDFGDKVELFFRKEIPRTIVGKIVSVNEDFTDPRRARAIITTDKYVYASNGKTSIPHLPQSLIENFTGGVFVVNGSRYSIESISLPGGNTDKPTFKVLKKEDRNMATIDDQSVVTQNYLSIDGSSGDLFTVIENMAKADSWGNSNPLSKEIEIGNNQWTTETEIVRDSEGQVTYDSSGNPVTRKIRGIWDEADISKIPNSPSYKVKFRNLKLANHPQFSEADPVEWYKGIVRIPLNNQPNTEWVNLPVIGIENVGGNHNTTIIYAYDGDNNYQNMLPNRAKVNFFPGYRVYLHADAAKGFNEASLLPALGEGYRQTLIGARTCDSSNGYRSPLGVPAILLAQEIILPQKPELPLGPKFATPPDKYNKSAYTFTVQLTHRPYAIVFYRSDLNSVLSVLYTQETKEEIIKDILPDFREDEYFTSRWTGLVNLEFDGNGKFKEYPSGSGFRFPNPDNPDFGFDKNNPKNPGIIKDLVSDAIYSAFIPITKQPLFYRDVENNSHIRPEMPAIKINASSNPELRFTDFTLDGAMMTSYFYCAREMGSKMQLGRHSDIMGPIQLINAAPPEAPVVQKVITQIADPVNGTETAVKFDLLPFPNYGNGNVEIKNYENIKKIYIYRTTNPADALSVRAMGEAVAKVDLDSSLLSSNPITVIDTFKDKTQQNEDIPYGDALYYRLVALREVKFKDHQGNDKEAYIPSLPTKIFLANVVDVFNPEPPEITAFIGSYDHQKLYNVRLEWTKTAYKGKYYLFKMNSVGNWSKVPNDPDALFYEFPDPLPKRNEDGGLIYHRFKVTVENRSGLLNLTENIYTFSRDLMGE